MNVLVTGSEGRIGRQATDRLLNGGHAVRGFDMHEPTGRRDDHEVVTGDLRDPDTVDRALRGMDAVIHLAAMMSWQPQDAGKLFAANVDGTFNLLQAAGRNPVAHFVFASSGEVYPELAPAYQPIDEDHPTRPTSTYGLTKLIGEEMVKHYGRSTGRSFTITRFSHTQAAEELLDPTSFFSGPRFYVRAKLRQLASLPTSPAVVESIRRLEEIAQPGESHYIGCAPDGTPYKMGIGDARDLAQGVVLALEHPASRDETFNIGPSQSVSFDQLVPRLAEATGLPVATVRLETTPYAYETSIAKARDVLGYRPEHDVYAMIAEASSNGKGNPVRREPGTAGLEE